MDRKKAPESKNFIDLTGVSGPMWERWNMVRNYLMAQTMNKHSGQNRDYYNGYGWLQPKKEFPFRPAEGPNGNVMSDLLLNPDYAHDMRYSPPDTTSPYFKEMVDTRRKRIQKNKRGSSSDY